MHIQHFSKFVLAVLLGVGAYPAGAAETHSPAKALVQQALQAELAGNSESRDSLLQQALESDPNFAPAHWQLGHVRIDNTWLPVAEVPNRPGDERQAAYLEKRSSLVDTAEQHRELARWCRKQGLAEESRLHWTKVLGFESQDAEALTALGLKWYEGRLLTHDQIDSARRLAGDRQQALRRWQPQARKLRQDLLSSRDEKVAAARAELGRLNDLSALPALELVFASNGASDKNDRLNLALIEVADRFLQPEATEILLRRAVLADSIDVRHAACEALKKRPMHTYVPQLIAAMPEAVQTKFLVQTLPNGTVIHEHEVTVDGPQGKQVFSYDSTVFTGDLAAAARVTPIAVASEAGKAAALEATVGVRKQAADQLRARLHYVLQATTGFEEPDDPQLWARQYAEYYGWSEPERSHAVRHMNVSEQDAYYSLPATDNGEKRGEPGRFTLAPRSGSGPVSRSFASRMIPQPLRGECFAAGTKVVTDQGMQTIETIQPGTRVLSQDVRTGEIDFKLVQERTLRRGMKIVKLHAGDEIISATFGHPFWVVGKGWRVAGHLEPGDRLRGLEKDTTVDEIDAGPVQEVYNLLVSDFGSYFVGNVQLLVHDDSQISDPGTALPGMLAEAR